MTGNRELILGIETSCDDTSLALVDRQGQVVAEKTINQFEIHAGYGGVFPELASRAHVHALVPTVREVLDAGNVSGPDLRAIGVTRGPGLIGSLLAGVNFAAGLATGWDVPVYGINHLRGHLRSVDLEEKRLDYPAIVLLVSGGHTFLAYLKNQNNIQLLGSTRDDSVGESYDKVARMMDLGFPGGPAVDRLAKSGIATVRFPRPLIREGYEFSFSGLKSAVARYLEQSPETSHENVCASFVEACIDVLMTKSSRALSEYPAKSFAIVGGVAASPQIRSRAAELADEAGANLCLPPLKWAADNGAMIALATWDYINNDWPKTLSTQTRIPISDI
jgi:N6-L-threonylcarbamoyladenine synthase